MLISPKSLLAIALSDLVSTSNHYNVPLSRSQGRVSETAKGKVWCDCSGTVALHSVSVEGRGVVDCWVKLEPLPFSLTLPTMLSHTIPTDNGKYDQLITITLESCRVTAQENDGRDGSGALIWSETYEFATECEAQAAYEAQIRKWDPQHFVRLEATARATANAVPVYLEFHDGNSHKFYEVTVIESTVNVRYGRVGTEGKTLSDAYSSLAQAQAAADKKLIEKLKKGYCYPNSPKPAPVTHPASISSVLEAMDATTPTVLAVTLPAGEQLLWHTPRIRPDCVLQIQAIAHTNSYSFNLMAQTDIVYHFNPRLNQAQVVQNTLERQSWGTEERFPLPPELGLGQEFELAIAVQQAEFVVYLNGRLLCRYCQRIVPLLIDGLRLDCGQGTLEVLAIKLSNRFLPQVASLPTPTVMPAIAVPKENRLSAEIETLLSYFDPGVVQRFPPATAEMIANAEQLLGIQFPPSLRSFLRVTNGLNVEGWMDLLGVPEVGVPPKETIVDWSLCYRDGETTDLIVLIQDGSGNPFCLLSNQRNEHGECAVTKVNHETWESVGVIASSLDRLLWFVLSDMQSYLRPDGAFKDEDELEDSNYDDERSWYDNLDYCLQHDPDIATFY